MKRQEIYQLGKPGKFLDQVLEVMRVKHYSIRPERSYIGWVKRFVLFHEKTHPKDMGEPEVESAARGSRVRWICWNRLVGVHEKNEMKITRKSCSQGAREVQALKGVVFQNAAQKFIQGTKEDLSRENPAFCIQRDLFDFILIAERVGERIDVTHTQ